MTKVPPMARAVMAAVLIACSGVAAAATPAVHALSRQAAEMHAWIVAARDNEGSPFAVIDKTNARLWLFDPEGRVQGSTPVLLGLARGDVSVPGIGEREMQKILPHERTTPAGRFIAEPGRNLSGEDIFWIDYDAAVSMHRVRATVAAERRLERLATPTADDNRISYGCINVPADFYDQRIRPAFTQRRGVVYLVPETFPIEVLFTPPGGAKTTLAATSSGARGAR